MIIDDSDSDSEKGIGNSRLALAIESKSNRKGKQLCEPRCRPRRRAGESSRQTRAGSRAVASLCPGERAAQAQSQSQSHTQTQAISFCH